MNKHAYSAPCGACRGEGMIEGNVCRVCHGLKVLPMNDEVWVTQDGRRLPVGEMDEDHVRAVLRMILRQRRRRLALRNALDKLGEQLRNFDEDDAKWGHG